MDKEMRKNTYGPIYVNSDVALLVVRLSICCFILVVATLFVTLRLVLMLVVHHHRGFLICTRSLVVEKKP